MFRAPQVILFSQNVSRAAAFYSSLGFTESFRVPTEGEPIHVDLALDGYKIGIAAVASTRDGHGLDPVPEGQRAAVILWADDTAAAFAELTANGTLGLVAPHEWLRAPVDRMDRRSPRTPHPDRPEPLTQPFELQEYSRT